MGVISWVPSTCTGTPRKLDADAMRAAQTLADVAAAYVTNARSRVDLQAASARARQRSLHDPLTGLPNRVLLLERLEDAFRGRRSRSLTAVLFCDLDKFKRINDVFGHRIGDEVLVAVAERLTAQLRPGDTLARLSGDEFVLVLEDVSEAEARVIADRIEAAFSYPFPLSCGEIRTHASIGIALGGQGNERPVKVLEKADLAMYKAKRESGGRSRLIDAGGQFALVRRRDSGSDRPKDAAVEVGAARPGSSAGRELPAHRLGDFLAGGTQPVALGIAPGHPLLAAEGPDGGPVDDPLDHAGTGRDERALLPPLLGRCSPPARYGPCDRGRLAEVGIGAGRGQGDPARRLGLGAGGVGRMDAVRGDGHPVRLEPPDAPMSAPDWGFPPRVGRESDDGGFC